MKLLRVWSVISALALAVHLGGYPLLDADEGRNAEVAREMAATNDYVMPRMNTLPYLDKPIVYFAAEAAVMEVLGPTEVAARLPAYLFTLATAAVIFWFARRQWGEEEGWVAVIAYLSMPLTMAFARTVIFDSALTFFIVVAIIAFYEQRTVVAWIAMALGVLTKGPIALLLPLIVAIPFAIKQKRFRSLWSPWGLLAFAAIIAPWVWAVSQVVPEFLRYVLITETAARVATKELQRTGPPWYFIPYLIGGALPWSIVAFSARRGERDRESWLYLLLWIVVPFVFFSISQSKRPQYILPVMPAIALLVARTWRDLKTRAAAITLIVFGAILLAAPLAFHRTKMKPEIAAVADEVAIALGIAFALGGVVALFAKRELAFVALSLPILAMPLLTNPLMQALGERRSTRSFVARLRPHLTPQTEVVGVEAFTGSLAFYLGKPVTLVSEDASELTSNYLIRRYEKFSTNPASTLKPLPWLDQNLGKGTRVYVLRNNDAKRRALLESRGFRLVAAGAHHVAYR